MDSRALTYKGVETVHHVSAVVFTTLDSVCADVTLNIYGSRPLLGARLLGRLEADPSSPSCHLPEVTALPNGSDSDVVLRFRETPTALQNRLARQQPRKAA